MLKSIRIGIMCNIMLVTAVVVIIVTGIIIFLQKDYSMREGNEKVQAYTNTYAGNMNATIAKIETKVKGIELMVGAYFDLQEFRTNPEYFNSDFEAAMRTPFQRIIEDMNEISNAYFTLNLEYNDLKDQDLLREIYYGRTEDGSIERLDLPSLSSYTEDPDSTDYDWYYGAIKRNAGFWSAPYEENGVRYISYTMPVRQNDIVLGVVGIDILFETMVALTSEMHLYQQGFAFMLNEDQELYVKEDKEKALQNFSEAHKKELYKLAKDNGSGVTEYQENGKHLIEGYVFLNSGHVLVSRVEQNDMLNELYKTIKTAIIAAIICILLSSFFAVVTAGRLSNPIKKVTKHLGFFAQGDFSREIEKKLSKRRNEIGILAKSTETMRHSVNRLITQIIGESDILYQSMNVTNENMAGMTAAVANINDSASQLSAAMEEVSASIDEVSTSSNTIQQQAEQMVNSSTENKSLVVEMARRAQELKATTQESTKVARDTFHNTNERMLNALKQSEAVNEVNVLLESIMQIVNQINLLALNASIEAARAGEHGKGFAVVAGEVKNLAQDSGQTIDKIQAVTKIVTNSVENLQKESQGILQFINESVLKEYDALLETSEQYNQDAAYMENIIYGMDRTAVGTLHSIELIATSMSQITAAIEECTSNTNEIAEVTSEMLTQSQEISQQSELVHTSAGKLKEMAEDFVV